MQDFTLLLISILSFIALCSGVKRCNELLCGSIVSKCLLTQSCKCELSRDPQKCSCCATCAKCLGNFYQACCSCLEMCDKDIIGLNPNDSQVGDFPDAFTQLFQAVANEDEPLIDAQIITFPVEATFDNIKDGKKLNVNCTVAFYDQCHSAMKCKKSCQEIGSKHYRYFFNGCCECVGSTCLNYGLNENRCRQCPSFDEVDYFMDDYVNDAPFSNQLPEDL